LGQVSRANLYNHYVSFIQGSICYISVWVSSQTKNELKTW